jgi:hypothetical protein
MHAIKQKCGCNLVIALSSSDYLLNNILLAIIKKIEIGLLDIINIHRRNDAQSSSPSENIAILTNNCFNLCDCIEEIIQKRKLDNFSDINPHIKSKLCHIFNKVFVDLTELNDPSLAFQVTKIIQILSIQSN